ncbi:hypothetical protein D9M72_368170 [compost metagenome]
MAVDAIEGEREDARTDQDEQHEGRKPGRCRERPAHHVHVETALGGCHDQRTDGAHRTAFGRRRDAEEDGAEDEEDQRQGRDQHDDDLLGKPRHRIDLQAAVDKRDDVDDDDADGAAEDVGILALGRVEIDVGGIRDACRHRQRNGERRDAGTERAGFQRQGRHRIAPDEGHQQDVDHVKAGQHEARDQGAGVHVAYRAAELVGKNDEHERRRDDLGKRARSRDDARGDLPVIAVAQHDRQRDQAHGDDRGGNDTGGGGKQRADEDDRIGKTAADRAEELADGVEQVFGHARFLEHDPHEGKERDGEQCVV